MFPSALQIINWDLLAERKIPAPFKPRIKDETDVSNFSEEFTDLLPTYSPAAVPRTADRVFKVLVISEFMHSIGRL